MYSNLKLFRSNLTLPVHQVQENHPNEHHIQEINDNYSMMLSIHVLKNLINSNSKNANLLTCLTL